MTTEIMRETVEGPQVPRLYRFSAYERMVLAPRWLLYKLVQKTEKSKLDKVPFYVDGAPRGATDTHDDAAKLVAYHVAKEALDKRPEGWGLGFALGPDGQGGHWQGIDFDAVVENGLADLANGAPGYVEFSPSGKGAHAIGYGQPFATLGSNGSGVEAYAGGRFFTVTEQLIRDGGLVCLADYADRALAPRHGAIRTTSSSGNVVEEVRVDPKTMTELRSALFSMRADDYHLWIANGMALRELGEVGRGLWLEWSATSEKFDPKAASKKWDGLEPRSTGYQAVFKRAQDQGWVNPASKAAQLPQPCTLEATSSPSVTLEFAKASDTASTKLEYLLDPYLPAKCVVGAFGRGSTAKSSFYASVAAHISSSASTLWVSVEELTEWIKVRHIRSGGQEGTMAIVTAVASKKDAQGRAIASSFNIYEHLLPAIIDARNGFMQLQKAPLRLVVLDTAVGLTSWGKGESPNDDAAVKKLLAYLQGLAQSENLTIIVIGHSNKGKHEHFADTVMGASAWTNSPRLSFVHAADMREDHAYVMRVAKTNFDCFGVTYRTEPVYTLHERTDGPDAALVKVVPGGIVWGDGASMEMFKEATTKPRDDEDEGGGHKFTLVGQALQKLVDMVHKCPEPITRDMVHEEFGREISRREWTKVDEQLRQAQFIYKVVIEAGSHNKAIYKRQA